MKSRRIRLRWLPIGTILLASAFAATAPAVEPPADKKPHDIYDRTADGEKQIAAALTEARRENKRVLLQFGANWCGWCHKLHDLFKTDRGIAKTLLYEYVVVLIDVDKVDGKAHNAAVNEKYGNPTRHGLPVLVVLDAGGKPLVTQNTGELEVGDRHDPVKVAAFLDKWKPEPVSAEATLSAAKARAKSESKNVFVHFSAPWCGWCKRLDGWLYDEKIEPVFSKAFVTVKIDVDRMTGGKEMDAKYRGEEPGGIPFFVILDGGGKRLADSMGPQGNVGFPYEPHEIEHFMKAMRQTTKLGEEQLGVLEDGFERAKKQKAG